MKSFLNRTAATALVGAGLAGVAGAGTSVAGDTEVLVTADITVSTTWTANNKYNLQNQIYVKNGATLTIQAGTVIASTPTINGSGSLAVTEGSQIFVQGTQDCPVIFTSTADVATWGLGRPECGTYREGVCSEWGNLTIMGSAYMNDCKVVANTASCNAANEGVMEGLTEDFPGDPDVRYGGGDDEDDSGSISYVSLRYGGRVLGLANELNGLSLGAIGRETDIHHVEVIANVDDGVEIWGGTVNLKHVIVWNVGDDSIDIDQGYRGKMQFIFIVQGYSCAAAQGSGVGDNCFETDGSETSDRQPVTTCAIYNATVVGQPSDGDHATAWRDNARVQYRNCIFMDIGDDLVAFDNVDGDPCGTGYGHNGTLSWANTWTTTANNTSAVNACPNPALTYQAQDATGFLAEIRSSCFFNIVDVTEATARGVFNPALNNQTVLVNPITSITRSGPTVIAGKVMRPVTAINPLPSGNVAATSAPNDGFYCPAPYKGAFEPDVDKNWAFLWSGMWHYGFLKVGVPGTTTVRNGGANPLSLSGNLCNVGDTWTISVNLAGTTGHAFANPFAFDTPFSFTLSGGQTLLCIDFGGSGELLALPFSGGATPTYNLCIPALANLCGFTFCTQAIHFGGVVPFALSNALDIVVGAS